MPIKLSQIQLRISQLIKLTELPLQFLYLHVDGKLWMDTPDIDLDKFLHTLKHTLRASLLLLVQCKRLA